MANNTFKVKIEQLPSGSYRLRKMYKGVTYTFVLPYKPTQKEANEMILEAIKEGHSKQESITFKKAAESYVNARTNTLSPATIRFYKVTQNMIPEYFQKKSINSITSDDVQIIINDLAADGKQPSSIRGVYRFINMILKHHKKGIDFSSLSFPKKVKKDLYIPSDEDVSKMLEALKGTKYEIVFRLECYGLRKSEAYAITKDDIDGNILTINKSLVLTPEGETIVRQGNKTAASTRKIYIDDELADMIREKGAGIYKSFDSANKYYSNVQDKLGIKRFSPHKLRHYFASKLSNEGIDIETIMRIGGWESPGTIEAVYRHVVEDAQLKKQKEVSDMIFKVHSQIKE